MYIYNIICKYKIYTVISIYLYLKVYNIHIYITITRNVETLAKLCLKQSLNSANSLRQVTVHCFPLVF